MTNKEALMPKQSKKDLQPQNRDFIQLYRGGVDVFRKISHNPTAMDIVTIIIKHMDSHNSVIATVKMLCNLTGKSKSSVYSAIKLLEEKNVVGVTNTGGTCMFVCNPNLAWTSYASGKSKYAEFRASVLVDESEFPDFELGVNKKRGALVNAKTGEM